MCRGFVSHSVKPLWLTLGILALTLGVAGIFLPLLPTVPFALLAAYCFSRSSKRMHDWLLAHPQLGPAIIDWQQNRVIDRRNKWLATFSVILVLMLSAIFGLRQSILLLQAGILSCVMIFIWTRAEQARQT